MAVVVDIVLIAIVALAAFLGYRRGVLKSVIKFVLLLVSVLLAKTLASPLAESLSGSLPMPGIGTKLASYLNVNMVKLEEMSLAELLGDWGFPEEAAKSVEEFVSSTAQSANESITRQVTPAIDKLLTEVIFFAFLLLVFWLIAILLTTLINNMLDLPVIGTANHILGLVAGIAVGLLTVLVITFIAGWSFPLLDASLDISVSEICEQSVVINFLQNLNPFMGLLG